MRCNKEQAEEHRIRKKYQDLEYTVTSLECQRDRCHNCGFTEVPAKRLIDIDDVEDIKQAGWRIHQDSMWKACSRKCMRRLVNIHQAIGIGRIGLTREKEDANDDEDANRQNNRPERRENGCNKKYSRRILGNPEHANWPQALCG